MSMLYTGKKGQVNSVNIPYYCDLGSNRIYTEKSVYIYVEPKSQWYIYRIFANFYQCRDRGWSVCGEDVRIGPVHH
jgi:hypothetical protein